MIGRRALPWLALPAAARAAPVTLLSGGALEPQLLNFLGSAPARSAMEAAGLE